MNIWTALILVGATLGTFAITKLIHAGENLVTEVKGRIHSIDWQNITFGIDTILKNPSTTQMTIQYPFIKIEYKGKLIASSTMSNQLVTVAQLSQTELKNIKIPVAYLNLGGIAMELLNKIQNKEKKIPLDITIITQVHVTGAKLPYSKTEQIFI